MPITEEQYKLRPTETVEEYQSRIAGLREKEGGNGTSDAAGAGVKQKAEEAGKAVEEQRGTVEKLGEKLTSFFKRGTGREEVREETFAEAGGEKARNKVMKLRPEVAQLNGELQQLKQQEREALRQAEDRLASQAAIDAEQTRIKRQFDRQQADVSTQLSAKSAMFEAWNGNLSEAKTAARNAAQAAAQESNFQFRALSTVINNEQQLLNSLEQDERDYLNQLRDEKQREAQRVESRANTLASSLITAANQGASVPFDASEISKKSQTREGFLDAMNTISEGMAGAIGGEAGGVEDLTQTERGIATARANLNDSVNEEGTVSLSDYLNIRSQVAISPDNFDDRFSNIYLSDGDRTELQSLKSTEAEELLNAILNQ